MCTYMYVHYAHTSIQISLHIHEENNILVYQCSPRTLNLGSTLHTGHNDKETVNPATGRRMNTTDRKTMDQSHTPAWARDKMELCKGSFELRQKKLKYEPSITWDSLSGPLLHELACMQLTHNTSPGRRQSWQAELRF